MPAFNKFQKFTRDLNRGVHQLHAAGHTLKAYLSNTAPNAATMAVKADLTEIAGGNGYTAGGHDTQNDESDSAGVSSVTGVDITITATGGSIGPFRYVVLYNDTPASPLDPLIGWWDYGSSITLADTEQLLIDFGSSMFTVT